MSTITYIILAVIIYNVIGKAIKNSQTNTPPTWPEKITEPQKNKQTKTRELKNTKQVQPQKAASTIIDSPVKIEPSKQPDNTKPEFQGQIRQIIKMKELLEPPLAKRRFNSRCKRNSSYL